MTPDEIMGAIVDGWTPEQLDAYPGAVLSASLARGEGAPITDVITDAVTLVDVATPDQLATFARLAAGEDQAPTEATTFAECGVGQTPEKTGCTPKGDDSGAPGAAGGASPQEVAAQALESHFKRFTPPKNKRQARDTADAIKRRTGDQARREKDAIRQTGKDMVNDLLDQVDPRAKIILRNRDEAKGNGQVEDQRAAEARLEETAPGLLGKVKDIRNAVFDRNQEIRDQEKALAQGLDEWVAGFKKRGLFASYGPGQPCEPGEAATGPRGTGCIPQTDPEGEGVAGLTGGLVDMSPDQVGRVAQIMEGAVDRLEAGELDAKARAGMEKLLRGQGMSPSQASSWMDAVAGKPEMGARALRLGSNYFRNIGQAIQGNFDRMVKLQTDSGVNPTAAKVIGAAGAVLSGSPVSITTLAVPIIGAWGATPGLGAVEGFGLVGLSMLGGRAVRAYRNRAAKRAEAEGIAVAEPPEFLQEDRRIAASARWFPYQDDLLGGNDKPQGAPTDEEILQMGVDATDVLEAHPNWTEDQVKAFLKGTVFLAIGAHPVEDLVTNAAAMVNDATQEELALMVAGEGPAEEE